MVHPDRLFSRFWAVTITSWRPSARCTAAAEGPGACAAADWATRQAAGTPLTPCHVATIIAPDEARRVAMRVRRHDPGLVRQRCCVVRDTKDPGPGGHGAILWGEIGLLAAADPLDGDRGASRAAKAGADAPLLWCGIRNPVRLAGA